MNRSRLSMTAVFITLLLVGFYFMLLHSPSDSTRSLERNRQTEEISIPFTLTEHNNISVPLTLNGKHKLDLMFHTGNSDVCLTEEATTRLGGLVFDQGGDAKSWGGTSSIRLSQNNQITIGNKVWSDITVVEDRLSGPGTDGKFGPDLFKNKVIEIDFDNQILAVLDFLPEKVSTFQKFICRQNRSSLFIEGELRIGDEAIANEFMIHSGFGGTILLDDEFVRKNKLDRLETISESELKDSFGNVLKTKKVILPQLSFGNSSFPNIPIGFFDGAIGKQKMSVVGGAVLKRFNIIIAADRSEVYLKPNSRFKNKFGS